MSVWSIEIVTLYRFRSPGPEVFFQRGFGETVEMAIHAFLLRNGKHRVLVDTGLPADFSELNAGIRARKGESAGFHEVGAGLTTELQMREFEPTAVVLTSFGPYAAGGLARFPDPPLFVSARGLADLSEPEEPGLVHPLAAPLRERLLAGRAVSGTAEILPGMVMQETGVHHPASAALVVRTAGGRVAIADPVFVTRNLTDGLALGAAEEAAHWHRMVRHLGTIADAVLPIHDPEPRPLPKGEWHPSLLRGGRDG